MGPSGKCNPVKCTVANSNKKHGPACACGNGFSGKITWKNNKPSGKCTIAPCKVANSNKQAGAKCKCNRGYSGTIRWMGSTAIGPCSKCGANSGFNADLTKNIFARSGWTEIKNWRTNANSELNLAGTLNLQKGQFVSLVTYSSNDASWKIHSESGFGCHRMNTKIGFHADQAADQQFGNGWNRITNWRTTGNNELYAMGGARVLSGFFAAPVPGYYACATTVRVAGTVYLKKGQRTSVNV